MAIENTKIDSITPIITPAKLKEEIVNPNTSLVFNTRQEIRDILHGQDTRRMLIIVGPCSIHDPKIAYDYAEKLLKIRSQLEDELLIVMRTYLEKPRTTVGWTGYVYDPHLDGSSDANTGLALSRQMLVNLNKSGIPCAVEFLDPITPQYFDDSVVWGAVGARTTEGQIHRQLASGLSMPIGFKNSTDGNITVAVDAMVAAANHHTFFGIDRYGQASIVRTSGNPDTHIVLRGSTKGTNYDEASIIEAINLMRGRNLITEASRPIMIDCSHGNSAKDHNKQLIVADHILERIQSGSNVIMAMMVESNINEGQQKWVAGQTLKYGVSVTDACLGWEDTERLMFKTARAISPAKYFVS